MDKCSCTRRDFLRNIGLGAAGAALAGCAGGAPSFSVGPSKARPNILWIIAEDMSPHWSCCGETTIQTPNIDRLAGEGVLFRNAFVTCPVCSPSRSAMITGMYQTTIGAHHHRSSWPGSEIHLPEHIKLLPEYFKQHGYYTSNGGPKTTVYHGDLVSADRKLGKTDYNFVWDQAVYDDNDWKNRSGGQPFFAQIQLRGGKYRAAPVPNPVDPAKVKLPPYYPDHPVIRADWAQYLNSVIYLDAEVGKILQRLEDEGIADNTVVFLWTDHGISHARGKQFLYDEGIRVPLIIRGPGVLKGGTASDDLVSHIDIAATSLLLAGIAVPHYMQGRPLFGRDYKPRDYIFAARDRCDETLDCIRCVRSMRYKYIRNFYPNRSHLQHNRYKDNKQIIKTIRRLFAEGKLDLVQARMLAPTRPAEELYDLANDPHEINNLAGLPAYEKVLNQMRSRLKKWIVETGDVGLIPEPELEVLTNKYGTEYDVLGKRENRELVSDIIKVIEAGERGRAGIKDLVGATNDKRPSIRWWAARSLGNMGLDAKCVEAAGVLRQSLKDGSLGVRVEAARALCKMGMEGEGLPVLIEELRNDDQIVRHYAALALEDIGEKARPALEPLKEARGDKYEYVMRISNRLVAALQGGSEQESE
ncbi:MAG TPA: sulfatase-like hydrolase/transferase [Sedimentisphaerales bacterium]|nr:sulfatase-like hydrolase/transferase [Sedimentisphaerales bacterium]